MQVELRNHPAQATDERTLPDGTLEITPLFDEAGKPVPLFPDQHGVYFSPAEGKPFRCVGYCLQRPGAPVSLIETFGQATAEFIHAKVDEGRGGVKSRLAMISALESEPTTVSSESVEEEPESLLVLPSTFAREEDDE